MALVRPMEVADLTAVLAIESEVIEHGFANFHTEPRSAAELEADWIRDRGRYPWLVAEASDGSIAGYAYATTWRARAAYAWTCEVSVYVAAPFRRHGLARRLYGALFERLREAGYVQAIAGITLPNPASVALHEALGFTAAGVVPLCGWKRGQWYDVGFWQLELAERPAVPQDAAERENAAC